MCTNQTNFLKNFLMNNELWINYELTMMQSTMLVQTMMQVVGDGDVYDMYIV